MNTQRKKYYSLLKWLIRLVWSFIFGLTFHLTIKINHFRNHLINCSFWRKTSILPYFDTVLEIFPMPATNERLPINIHPSAIIPLRNSFHRAKQIMRYSVISQSGKMLITLHYNRKLGPSEIGTLSASGKSGPAVFHGIMENPGLG